MGLTIVLLDDDKLINLVNSHLLKSTGKVGNVHTFTSPVSALTFFQELATGTQSIPDFVLIDLSMPELTGFEFYEKLVQQFPGLCRQIQFGILTSSLNAEDRHQAEQLGIDIYLTKPLVPLQAQILIDLVESRRAHT